jgi:hypothetical protein
MAPAQDHLEGDHPLQSEMPGFVDHAHATAAENSLDSVAGNSQGRRREALDEPPYWRLRSLRKAGAGAVQSRDRWRIGCDFVALPGRVRRMIGGPEWIISVCRRHRVSSTRRSALSVADYRKTVRRTHRTIVSRPLGCRQTSTYPVIAILT